MWGHYIADIDAHPGAETIARSRVRRWLDTLGWPSSARGDLIRAVCEAVSNAAEHAYPPGYAGLVRLRADLLAGPNAMHHLAVSVTDRGRWREPAPDSNDAGRHDGGGLAVIRAGTAHMRIEVDARGTRVRMISRPVRLPGSSMPKGSSLRES